jgi:hypothetical protein
VPKPCLSEKYVLSKKAALLKSVTPWKLAEEKYAFAENLASEKYAFAENVAKEKFASP